MLIGMGTPNVVLPLSAAACREVDLLGVFRCVYIPPPPPPAIFRLLVPPILRPPPPPPGGSFSFDTRYDVMGHGGF